MSGGSQLRVAVLGAGGIGSKFGGMLALGGRCDVTLVYRRPSDAADVTRRGLTVQTQDSGRIARVRAVTDPAECGPVDVVLVAVKAYDTEAAAAAALPLMDENSLAITLQNGLGNLEVLQKSLGGDRSVLGVTFNGATLLEPWRVADMGRGPTYLASTAGQRERLRRLADALSESGLVTEVLPGSRIQGMLWGKVAMVAGINPVAAVLQIPNGAIGEVPEAQRLAVQAISEAIQVATALGIELAFDPLERFVQTTRATADMKSGMLLDLMRGRGTEIDAISGAIGEQGRRVSVDTPMNDFLWHTVRALEATFNKRVS